MKHCDFCGSELPVNAHFCGICGRLLNYKAQAEADITYPSTPGVPEPKTPPLFSDPSYPIITSAEAGQQDQKVTIRHKWTEEEMKQSALHFQERKTDESQVVLPDMLLPGMLIADGQMPSPGQLPMVQGTPQAGGVPSIQGTPPVPGNPPPSGHVLAHGAAPSAPPRAPTWQQQVSSSPHHPVHQPQPAPPPHHHPAQYPQPTPPPHEPPLEHHRHHSGPLHAHKPRSFRHHGTASGATTKLALGAASKWLVIVLTAVVVIATSGVVLVLANPPGLSLTGNSAVTAGGILHLHGKGFLPGGSVKLTLDNGLSVSLNGQHIPQGAERNANFAGSSQMFIAGGLEQRAAADANISVSATGTFDASIAVSASWSAGVHTIHATESLGSRSASLPFTILQAKLVVKPAMLDFGSLEVGTRAVLAVTVSNQGKVRLSWTASTGSSGATWLTLQNSAGVIEANNPSEFIYVAADTTRLKEGTYTATLNIHSNGGDAQVPVNLIVVPPSVKKQALLNVTPQSLDFGQIPANQQVLQGISISNLGQLPLKWQATTDATSAGWLSLSVASGTVQPGATPQTIQVLVNTTGLAAGSYTGTINITSNGGNAQVAVTLTVSAPQRRSPTPSPTPPPPPLIGSPNSFSVPGDPNCKYSPSLGWTCTATLSSFAGAKTNLNWSAASSGVSGVTFSPQSGTLTPGTPAHVTISIPNVICPASATFTFSGPANRIVMPWSCGALTLTTSAASINANTGCSYSNGWTCNLTLGTGPGGQGELSWSASGSGINGIGFSPASGTLTAGQPATVTITVPSTICPNSASITFAVQGGAAVTVPWTCGTPTLNVSPTSFSIPTNTCSYIAGQGWGCTTTLSLGSTGDPSVSWSVSGGITGTTFNPPGGIVSAGTPVTVIITVPDTACPNQANIVFTGPGTNSVTVPWNCAAPVLTAAATPSTCPQNSDGSYTCTDTVSESASSQGSLIWSASASGNLPGVTFSPQNGILGPNGSTQVTITVPANDCTNGSFIYSELGTTNTATVSWTCTPPQATLSVSPLSFNSNNCSNNGTTWVCTATLTSNATLNWYATSSDPSAIGFNPSSGTVSPGQPVTVQVDIPGTCPSSATLNFVGPSNTVTVQWSC